MDVRSCKSCGRLFNYLSGLPICDSCKAALEEKFQEVKEYIREHANAPVNVVAEECQVSVKQIKQWIREERLVLTEGSEAFLNCENCGAPIRTGRFCEKCKNKLQGELQNAYSRPKAPEIQNTKEKGKDKMRFLDS